MSVYFITARETGVVKIGCARDPLDRLATLQTASPARLKLEAILDGSYGTESELHARFDHCRVRGEWFELTEEIEQIIREADAAPTIRCEPKDGHRRKGRSLEDAIIEQIRRERELYAEAMCTFAKMDRELDLGRKAA